MLVSDIFIKEYTLYLRYYIEPSRSSQDYYGVCPLPKYVPGYDTMVLYDQDYHTPPPLPCWTMFFHNIMHNIYARFKKYMILVHHHHHYFLPSKESIKIPNKFTDVSYKLLDPYAKLNYIKVWKYIALSQTRKAHTAIQGLKNVRYDRF